MHICLSLVLSSPCYLCSWAPPLQPGVCMPCSCAAGLLWSFVLFQQTAFSWAVIVVWTWPDSPALLLLQSPLWEHGGHTLTLTLDFNVGCYWGSSLRCATRNCQAPNKGVWFVRTLWIALKFYNCLPCPCHFQLLIVGFSSAVQVQRKVNLPFGTQR